MHTTGVLGPFRSSWNSSLKPSFRKFQNDKANEKKWIPLCVMHPSEHMVSVLVDSRVGSGHSEHTYRMHFPPSLYFNATKPKECHNLGNLPASHPSAVKSCRRAAGTLCLERRNGPIIWSALVPILTLANWESASAVDVINYLLFWFSTTTGLLASKNHPNEFHEVKMQR